MIGSSLFGSHSVLLSSVARVSAPSAAPVVQVAPAIAPPAPAVGEAASFDDIGAMFGIEMAEGAAVVSGDEVARVLCGKCHGRGNFISYSGRVVGQCFACEGSGSARVAPAAAAEIDVSAIARAFASARAAGIKTPRLRLDSFVFSRAPDHGSNAGAIYVKHQDSGEYLGKVIGGHFHPVRSCDDATKARVVDVAANPHSAAKAYGMKFGICSCCGRELSNAESVRLGIGPICRDKFGW